MSILTLPLEPSGPIITIGFVVSGPRQSALKKAGQPVPDPVIARCLLDTGDSGTCVDSQVIAKLQIPPSGTVPIHTPSTGATPKICNQFDVGIGIIMDDGAVHLPGVVIPVIESDLDSLGIQALLGRDILDQALLIYDGHGRTLTLAF